MSAEEEKEGLSGETPGAKEPAAEKKPAAAKKAGAKAPAARKQPAAEKQPDAKGAEAKAGEKKAPAAKKTPAAKKPAAKKAPASEKPAETAEPIAKEKAAPAKRGQAAKQAPRRKVVRARARYVRTSARKARMVCGHLRGKTVGEARAILAFIPREVARDWSKLLESAVANAESNHELLEDDLIVREAYADEGPTIKRFRPRAMGRATPIRKRTSHLTITLTPGPEPGTTSRRS
jgi:ribosomal protein L22